jgi:uncharacterized membrane protein
MVIRRNRLVIVAALVALVWGAPAAAQGQGKITGVVRDTTGAALPGVTVTATNPATTASETTTTGDDGSYSLSVAPGAYTVTIAILGFRRVTQTVEVADGGVKQINVSMVPLLSEAVNVTA